MGAFELNSSTTRNDVRNDVRNDTHREIHSAEELSSMRPQPECTIALKVYDSCLLKKCLDDLGAVREYNDGVCGERLELTGDLENADEVKIDSVSVRITGIKKRPHRSKPGFWDITIRFSFVYVLEFFEDGELIEVDGHDYVKACDSFAKTITLYGAPEVDDLVFATDLINEDDHDVELHDVLPNLKSEPFVWIEAKAVGLDAEIREVRVTGSGRPETRREAHVTIGLIAIIKLFRLVNMSVMSTGLCPVPDECTCEGPKCENPCDYFKNLDFPSDIFFPPSKPVC